MLGTVMIVKVYVLWIVRVEQRFVLNVSMVVQESRKPS